MESTAVGDVRTLIIVGSGPAGYTAAVYAAPSSVGLRRIGHCSGALMNTTDVEEYPGFQTDHGSAVNGGNAQAGRTFRC